MDDEFLHEICAVSDTGDEGRAGDSDSAQWQAVALRANEQRGKADREQWKLPDAGGEVDVFAFAEPQRVNDHREAGQPKPDRVVGESFPPWRPEFFDRSEHNTEDKRIEPGPGWIIDPGWKSAQRDATINRWILPGE